MALPAATPTTRIRAFGTLAISDASGAELSSILAHPKESAILLYLALATPRGFHRRDTLVALFWPRLPESRARAALNKAIHRLRRALGDDVLVRPRDDVMGLVPGRVECDVEEFEMAVARGEHARAVGLYDAELLAGFHLGDAPLFMEWLDGRRRGLCQAAKECALEVSHQAAQDNDLRSALAAARRAMALDAFEERAVRATILLEDSLGDRAGAVRTYHAFAAHLRRELDTDPAPETQAAFERVRARTTLLLGTASAELQQRVG